MPAWQQTLDVPRARRLQLRLHTEIYFYRQFAAKSSLTLNLALNLTPALILLEQDASAAVGRASQSGADTSDYDKQLTDWQGPVTSFTNTCDCLTDLFNSFPGLFVPSMVLPYRYLPTRPLSLYNILARPPL